MYVCLKELDLSAGVYGFSIGHVRVFIQDQYDLPFVCSYDPSCYDYRKVVDCMIVNTTQVDGSTCSVHNSGVGSSYASVCTPIDEGCPLSVSGFAVDIVDMFGVCSFASSYGKDVAGLAL